MRKELYQYLYGLHFIRSYGPLNLYRYFDYFLVVNPSVKKPDYRAPYVVMVTKNGEMALSFIHEYCASIAMLNTRIANWEPIAKPVCIAGSVIMEFIDRQKIARQ